MCVVDGAVKNGEVNESFSVEEGSVTYLDLVLPSGKPAGPGTSDHFACLLVPEPTPLQLQEVGDGVRRQVWCAQTCGAEQHAGSVAIHEGDSLELVTHVAASSRIMKGVMKMVQAGSQMWLGCEDTVQVPGMSW